MKRISERIKRISKCKFYWEWANIRGEISAGGIKQECRGGCSLCSAADRWFSSFFPRRFAVLLPPPICWVFASLWFFVFCPFSLRCHHLLMLTCERPDIVPLPRSAASERPKDEEQIASQPTTSRPIWSSPLRVSWSIWRSNHGAHRADWSPLLEGVDLLAARPKSPSSANV
jgi:hypothetical protein